MRRIYIILLLLFLAANLFSSEVLVLKVDGAINPVSNSYIQDGLEKSKQEGYECMVLKLNTPGGLMKSMKEVTTSFLNTEVPVVVYVSPRGSRAASAGVFVTMAGHIAVMSPTSNIGAAHPVQMGQGGQGNAKSEKKIEKVTNDAVAHLKSIAEERERNETWVDSVIRKSVSITAKQALKKNIIDYMAPNLDSLLNTIHGDTVSTASGKQKLATKNARKTKFEMSYRQKILYTLLDPSVAYILMMLGMLGIFFELSQPGVILPGIVGGISLLLAFYAFSILPINYAGVLLIIFGVILFIIDTQVPSQGMLTLGGIVALLIGSFLLTSGNVPALQINWTVIIPVVGFISAFFIFVVTKGVLSQLNRPTTGTEGLIGMTGIVYQKIDPKGKVRVHGEIWHAVSDEEIEVGEEVKVTDVLERMTLRVAPCGEK